MLKIPEPKALAASYRRMDQATRSRLERVARRGELASDRQQAAIVVGVARRALRQLRWTVVLSGALLVLNLVSAMLVENRDVRWLNIAVVALSSAVIALLILRKRPLLLRAELRNRDLVEETGRGEPHTRD